MTGHAGALRQEWCQEGSAKLQAASALSRLLLLIMGSHIYCSTI